MKTKLNAKDVLIPAVALFLIALVATLLLAVVNNLTADKIAEQNALAAAEARQSVMPDAADFKAVDDYYEALDADGNVIGYVFDEEGTSKGYGSALTVTVGVDADGVVTGIVPDDLSNETPGLGQNASKDSFKSQFIGRSGTVAVSKDGGEIQALTSATITSRAVTSAVQVALDHYATLVGGAK